jgi:hypothetical protein
LNCKLSNTADGVNNNIYEIEKYLYNGCICVSLPPLVPPEGGIIQRYLIVILIDDTELSPLFGEKPRSGEGHLHLGRLVGEIKLLRII